MRRLLLAAPLALSLTAVQPSLAQPSAAAVEAVTAAQVQGLIDAAKADRKNGEPLITKSALSLAPYSTVVEYRPGTAPAALHATNAELFYVVEGAATMVTGGALVGQKDAGPGNWSGTGIAAGKSRAIAKGDWIIVPQGSPHQIDVAAGTGGVVVMTIKIPRS